jgi:Asp-tRNA(Asn)/Glu-tRNA(Gln) amidotransferase A subunit family amidase
MLDDLDGGVAAAFERTLALLSEAGARIDRISLPELASLSTIQSTGGFSAAESWTGTAACSPSVKPATTRAWRSASGAAKA